MRPYGYTYGTCTAAKHPGCDHIIVSSKGSTVDWLVFSAPGAVSSIFHLRLIFPGKMSKLRPKEALDRASRFLEQVESSVGCLISKEILCSTAVAKAPVG